ncbi:hypothetical protein DERP_010671 [Dermatophagoides pteronyssinus]|uniref:Uncharacterized protein n=1 Tax=Dermatophagoides pteronyssinus TaxID=6956 RepID=A0ABQ8JA29_DERPT|nr:hypothetical protein DERP_010671 [Dermatophagoides pteronyssinus]
MYPISVFFSSVGRNEQKFERFSYCSQYDLFLPLFFLPFPSISALPMLFFLAIVYGVAYCFSYNNDDNGDNNYCH